MLLENEAREKPQETKNFGGKENGRNTGIFFIEVSRRFHENFRSFAKKRNSNERREKKALESVECCYTTIISEDYPYALQYIKCPPFVLFYKGNLELLNNDLVNIVGTKKNDEYGKKITQLVVKTLVENDVTLIEENNQGIEKVVVDTVQENNKEAVVVLNDGIGCETNQTLIDSIQQNGLVISEYPGKKRKTKKSSMFSRRLSTGLSSKVIVTQSGIKSESMVSASYALEAYKDVYVFPEAYDSKFKGNNKLIKEGANIITNMEDLVDN